MVWVKYLWKLVEFAPCISYLPPSGCVIFRSHPHLTPTELDLPLHIRTHTQNIDDVIRRLAPRLSSSPLPPVFRRLCRLLVLSSTSSRSVPATMNISHTTTLGVRCPLLLNSRYSLKIKLKNGTDTQKHIRP